MMDILISYFFPDALAFFTFGLFGFFGDFLLNLVALAAFLGDFAFFGFAAAGAFLGDFAFLGLEAAAGLLFVAFFTRGLTDLAFFSGLAEALSLKEPLVCTTEPLETAVFRYLRMNGASFFTSTL